LLLTVNSSDLYFSDFILVDLIKRGSFILMSSSTSLDDLALKLEWYEIRDYLLGQNGKQQDVKRALELASICQHPDAQWLTGVCAGKDVKTDEEARAVFLAQGNDDAQALCFAALIDEYDKDVDLLCQSAEMDFPLAQALMWPFTSGLECFTFASKAAAQGERDGFQKLGRCYNVGVGCEIDYDKAKKNYIIAAKMEDVDAMYRYGELFDESDAQHWHWSGLAAARGSLCVWDFLRDFPSLVNRFEPDPSLAPAVFVIGRALRGQIDAEKRAIFGYKSDFDLLIGPANRAVDFFTTQCAAARKAVDTWCLMAVRLNSKVNRDIRKKIGMLIWDLREQADYAVIESNGGGVKRARVETSE